jgi:PAS domain S-box-containing protein
MHLEIRTTFLFYLFIVSAGSLVLASLWRTHKNKYEGLHLFSLSFFLQAIALVLVILRGQIPDFFSIIISNLLSLGGMVLLYFGLSTFIGQKPRKLQSLLLIAIYSIFLYYHTYISPQVHLRMISFSLFFIGISLQSIWFLSRDINAYYKSLTRDIQVLIWLYILINIIRIFKIVGTHQNLTSYFDSGLFEAFVIIAYSILSVLLSFSIVIAVNRRLIEEIKLQDEKFYRAFRHAPNAIILSYAATNTIFKVNDSFTKITGYNLAEVIGKESQELNLWVDLEVRNKLVSELIEKGELHNKKAWFKRKNQSIFEGILHAAIIKTDSETLVLTTVEDTTEEKKLINKLQETASELEESNRAKDKLFSIIAHDLKSPFGNVVALSQILKEQIEAGEYSDLAKHAHAIEISSKRASDLLQNLLEWSRLKIGTLAFNPSLIDPQILVDEVIDLVRVNLEKKELKVSVQNQINMPLLLDKNIMSTVLRNLLSNAIKFTHRGGHIWLHILNIEGGVSFTVQDNGVGIPNEKIPLLFDISEKTSTLGTEQEKGTGLGLPICKELLEKHGGTIEVKSIPMQGATFICKLPNSFSG